MTLPETTSETSGPEPVLPGSDTQAISAAERSRLDALFGDPQVLIEITSRCNFSCDYCSSAFKERKKLDMDPKLFEHVVSQLPKLTTKNIRLHIDGEPTLHPRFYEMASLVNSYGLKVGLATNGSLLKKEWLDLDMELVITVSTDPYELKKRHKKLDFDQYVERVENYTREWARGDSPQKLMLQLIHNHAGYEAEDADERWNTFMEKFVQRTGLREYCQADADRPEVFRKASGRPAVLIKYPIVAGGLYPEGGKAIEYVPRQNGFCDSAWKRLAILADGRVSYCCIDLSGGTAFTRPEEIWEEPLEELWMKHPRIQEVRDSFTRGEILDSICKTCLAASPTGRREVGFNS